MLQTMLISIMLNIYIAYLTDVFDHSAYTIERLMRDFKIIQLNLFHVSVRKKRRKTSAINRTSVR